MTLLRRRRFSMGNGKASCLPTYETCIPDCNRFKDRLLTRQAEMQELIRNISINMSKLPLVQKIKVNNLIFKLHLST